MRPAIANEHGTYLERGLLDDLFGIERSTTRNQILETRLVATDALTGVTVALEEAQVDGSVRASRSGTLCRPQGPPVLISQQVGEGQTVLLNFRIQPYLKNPRYQADRNAENTRGLAELITAWLARGGVEPRCVITDRTGRPPVAVKRMWFRRGPARMLGMVNTPQDAPYQGPLSVTVDRPYHVYDPRAARYLGRVSQWQLDLPQSEGAFYSLLPYRVSRVTLQGPHRAQAGAELVVTIGLEATARPRQHLLSLMVTDPYGHDCRWWRRFLWLDGEFMEAVSLPMAYNEKPGEYTLTVRDVLTGLRSSMKFTVERPVPTRQHHSDQQQ